MTKNLQMEIYKDFIRARVGIKTIAELCLKYKMSRQAIYKTATKVFGGNNLDYKRAVSDAKWKYIYSPTYEIIKGLNSEAEKKMFSHILREMVKDEFSIADISKYIKRGKSGDRKIIYQYLK